MCPVGRVPNEGVHGTSQWQTAVRHVFRPHVLLGCFHTRLGENIDAALQQQVGWRQQLQTNTAPSAHVEYLL